MGMSQPSCDGVLYTVSNDLEASKRVGIHDEKLIVPMYVLQN